MQLVDVDRTVHDRLREIAQWAEEKRYDEAQEALHLLMTAEKPAFFPDAESKCRYTTTADAAARLLGTLPDEVLDQYCKRHDMAAQKLFEDARAKADWSALRSVGERYFPTPHGGKALGLLAAAAMDRGEHLVAAVLWERLYREHRRLGADRAMLLCKACVAYHLAGLREKAASLLAELKTRHAAAEAAIAGERVLLRAFLEKALAAQPVAALPPIQPSAEWRSLAGSARSVALMTESAAAALPLSSGSKAERAGFIEELLGSGKASTPADPSTSATFSAGRVRVRKTVSGQPPLEFDLPPLIHPVTIGGMVLCRREAEVVATSLASGNELWRIPGLPLYRPGEDPQSGGGAAEFALAGDLGRYGLTVGDGRVYTVCKFRRLGRPTYRFADGQQSPESEGSSLVALAVKPGGADVTWEVGCGKGEPESLRQAKYLSAPTFHQGRLYVLARLGNRYHAMCLDAAKGTLLWETPVGLVPMRGGAALSWQQAHALEVTTERGSPPAVADGAVLLTTNSGVIAALEAASGAPRWAHRYDSLVSGPATQAANLDLQGQAIRVATLRRPYWPVNPLIVAQGRVVSLPCDSDSVLALDAQTGSLLWRTPRQEQQDLTAMDDGVLLLSGPDLTMLQVRDGGVLRRVPGRILGRPAVTAGGIIAAGSTAVAGQGCIVRIDRGSGAVEEQPLLAGDAVLGRMLLAGGRLVGANATGLSVYADSETAVQMLASSLARATRPAQRAELALRAGRLALSAGRLEDAARQLGAAAENARKASDATLAADALSLLFEARIRQYIAAESDRDADRFLTEAVEHASTAGQRERILVEQVRRQEQKGRPAEAARAAQAVLDRHAGAPQAATGDRLREYFVARRELARLIVRHGEAVYAPMEKQMAAALDRAAAKRNPDELTAIHRRWPLASRAGDALLLAAEALWERSLANSPPDERLVRRASRLLGEVGNDRQEAMRVRAAAAQTLIDLRFRPLTAAAMSEAWKAAAPSTQVRFAAFSGTLGDLRKQLAGAQSKPMPAEDHDFSGCALPLGAVWELPCGPGRLLLDTRGQAVRLADRVFILTGERELRCFDARRNDGESACLWTIPLPPPSAVGQRLGQLGADGRRLAIVDARALLLVDPMFGRVLGQKPLDGFGPRGWTRAAGNGDSLVLADHHGTTLGIRLSDGDVVWQGRFSDFDMASMAASCETLLASDWTRGRHRCWDMRTGRILAEPAPRVSKGSAFSALLTPEGLVVAMSEAAVTVHDIRFPDGEARKVDLGDAGWRLFGAGPRFVGLKSPEGKLRVLDLFDLKRTIELDAGSGSRLPLRLLFHADRALLLSSGKSQDEEPAGLGLTAFDLPSGKPAWGRPLVSEKMGACRSEAVAIYGDVVSLAVVPHDTARPVRQLVVKIDDGAVFDCSTDTGVARRDFPGVAGPVVLNGRVLVAGQDGVACLMSLE